MITVVYTTSGATRFHWDRQCRALAAGRVLSLRQGEEGVYPVAGVDATAAALTGYTACRVCVPPALALPATGETYGHKPVNEYAGTPFRTQRIVCARCVRWVRWRPGGLAIGTYVAWPCTSAVVLGLVPRDGA
jgi:hypothetical protein